MDRTKRGRKVLAASDERDPRSGHSGQLGRETTAAVLPNTVVHAIESLNASVRKAGSTFLTSRPRPRLIWLALRNIAENWKNPPISWHAAKAQLAIEFADRFVLSE